MDYIVGQILESGIRDKSSDLVSQNLQEISPTISLNLKTVNLSRFSIQPNGVAMVKTKQKSPSCLKGFNTLVPKIVEVRIDLL